MEGVTSRPAAGRRAVAVVAFDEVQLLDVCGPVEVLTTANSYGADYDVRVVSPSGDDVRTSCGVRLGIDGGPGSLPPSLDTVIVAGRRDWRRAVADTGLVTLVAQLSARAGRTASVCAGAFVLAAAGLLDGRRAATHWELAADLTAAFPRVVVEADPLFVRDGDVVTSAGVSAGVDLALSLVEADCGAGTARDVARRLVVFMARPGGQSQFSARMVGDHADNTAVRRVMDTVVADPAAAHDLPTLAGRAGLSPRHLGRVFRAATGLTPGQYVEAVRAEAAQALLADGERSVEEIAHLAGFGSAETLRRVFQQRLGVAPTAYRARFRTTAVGSPTTVTAGR
ncbi:GlxA family transcriptional regulator [Streptomyces sp. MMS24-I2-30]|uniref:GlxA family transcriptional regulator n=1 Tax=Streptomyces sp. MMS24-I2-30 TaxID=3351564 RepID=UPI003896E6AA